jgi:NhaA family Na+:H+ antiporter
MSKPRNTDRPRQEAGPDAGAGLEDSVAASRLDRPVDARVDHILGTPDAVVTLVEYGSYACPHCRAADERVAGLRDEFGERLVYVFRHRPLTGNPLARRAAELAEMARTQDEFWTAHEMLMHRSSSLTEDDLRAVATELGIAAGDDPARQALERDSRAHVDADERSAHASGVLFTPSFFINGRKYEGAWDSSSFADAVRGTLGYRLNAAAIDFMRWGPAAGFMLLAGTILAVVLTNSPVGDAFTGLWRQSFSLGLGDAAFAMPLLNWVNDGLLTIFFLAVGLEIKREFTVGHLADRRSASLPVAAAFGGMIVPALLYLLIVPPGPWAAGWGIPIATDTAFAVALVVALGRRVPVELRIFLTAAAIVDDVVVILIVALFYSHGLDPVWLVAAAAAAGALVLFNRWGIYRVLPYAVLGCLLWIFLFLGGLHATLAGVLLSLIIPTRPPPDLRSLMTQAGAIVEEEDERTSRLESPASRMLRQIEPWSSYVVLPIFALANAGVVLAADYLGGHGALMAAIIVSLVAGKPVGLVLGSFIAMRLGLAVKPGSYSWAQMTGASALGGIGFTMSLFIAGQAFPAAADFAAAKIAIFTASMLAAGIGVVLLWRSGARAAH